MQNIAQLAAVADAESRRKISEISSEEKPIYGIAATTYWNWQMPGTERYTQSRICGIKDANKDDVVAGIIIYLLGVLFRF